jgi:hypothetical protein
LQYPFVEKPRGLEGHGTRSFPRMLLSYDGNDEESFTSELDLSVPHGQDELLQ